MSLSSDDRSAIADVLASWALGYDERDVARMARCFTEDASMVLEIEGAPTMGPFIGHAEVMKHFTDHHEIQTDQRRHVVANPIIDHVDRDEARSASVLVLLVTDEHGQRVQATGVYRDRFVRTADGWRIAERHLRLDGHY